MGLCSHFLAHSISHSIFSKITFKVYFISDALAGMQPPKYQFLVLPHSHIHKWKWRKMTSGREGVVLMLDWAEPAELLRGSELDRGSVLPQKPQIKVSLWHVCMKGKLYALFFWFSDAVFIKVCHFIFFFSICAKCKRHEWSVIWLMS